jgi:hypothetical protein
MHDDPLSQQHLNPMELETARLDQRVVHALEIAPEPQVPAGFAALVASRLPARRSVSLTRTRYGYYAMLVSMVILLTTLLLLAPHTTERSMFELTLQWLLCAQFIGLAVWLSVSRRGVS